MKILYWAEAREQNLSTKPTITAIALRLSGVDTRCY